MTAPTRREFITTLACGVAVACTGCGGNTRATLPTTPVSAGNVSALSVGDLKAVTGEPLAIGRDANGVYAMSAVCTHADCDMTVSGSISSSGAFCSCHGSRFDANGNVTQGPARTALEHLAVTVDGSGNITIDPTKIVAASARVAV